MTYQIDNHVPTPPKKKRGDRPDALRELAKAAVGSSVFFPDCKPNVVQAVVQVALGVSMSKAGMTSRAVDGGIRVWKIAERAA